MAVADMTAAAVLPPLPPPRPFCCPAASHLYALQLMSPSVFMSSRQAASLGGLGGLMDASSTAVV